MHIDQFKEHCAAWLEEVKAELPSPTHMHPIVYIEQEWHRLVEALHKRLGLDKPAAATKRLEPTESVMNKQVAAEQNGAGPIPLRGFNSRKDK